MIESFPDLLEQYRIPYHGSPPQSRPGWINLRCVRCDRDPYLGYNLAYRYCHCWSCGYISLLEVIRTLTGLSGQDCQKLANLLPRQQTLRPVGHTGKLQLPAGVTSLLDCHKEYLHGRGFDPEQIQRRWGVQGIGFSGGRLRWRLWIPIHLHGQVVSWTSRAIGEYTQPRYYSARDDQSDLPLGNLLYGWDHVGATVVLTEGPTDVWRLGPGAVALMGLRLSPVQRLLLSRVPRRVVCLDSEPVAQERARTLCRDLAVLDGVTVNYVLKTGKDLAAAQPEEIQALRQEYLN